MKRNSKMSIQEKKLSRLGNRTKKSVRKLVTREPEAIFSNERQDMKKMDLMGAHPETKCPFGRISPITSALKGRDKDVSEQEDRINQITGTHFSHGGSFQTVDQIRDLDQHKQANCRSRKSLCLKAESERPQSFPKKIVEFPEIQVKEQEYDYFNCESTEIDEFLDNSPSKTDSSPLERNRFPKFRYKKAHIGLRNGKTHFLETPPSPNCEEFLNVLSSNTKWNEFVFKTPERKKNLSKIEIRVPSRPTQKCSFKNIENLGWAMNLFQNETQSNTSDSTGLSGSNLDTSFYFSEFNRFFEDLDDNSAQKRLTASDFELDNIQRSQNLPEDQALPETVCQTIELTICESEKPENLGKLKNHNDKQKNVTQGTLLIVNPNICSYQDTLF